MHSIQSSTGAGHNPPWRVRPPRLSLYVLGQLLVPVAVLTFLMTSVIWLVTILPYLDLVINRGQSAFTFFYLILLVLPTPLVIIMPIAFFFAALFTLNRLQSDSELVVMASAGYSIRQLALPVLVAAAIVMALTYACLLWLMPAGQRALRDKVVDIRADMAGALLSEGDFNTSQQGLTIFIRQLTNKGEIKGILVHDNRNRAKPVTYIAEKGILAQTPAGTRLIMLNGTIENQQRGRQAAAGAPFRAGHDQPGPVLRAGTLYLAQNERTLSRRIAVAQRTGRHAAHPRSVFRQCA